MATGKSDDELAQTATAVGSPTPSPAGAPPKVGATLGRYKIERTLGEGGMGVVHAAFDPDLERRVALKVLRTDGGDDQARQRLLREARAMARLTHPNVVTVHEVGSANGRDYVAMELVDGETLADWLRAAKRDPDEILATFVAAGRGLAAAHAAGLVHRDFKPHNVLRRRDGRISVTDFGLARGVDAAGSGLEATMRIAAGVAAEHTPSSLSGLTATGSVLGTPAYMAPEQWGGGTIGPAADQFAFCVALWEALTGERPFRGNTIEELKQAVRGGPEKLDTSKLPRRVRRALCRGLDPDPDKRWPSIDALLAAIARDRRRPYVAIASVAAVVFGCAAIWFVLSRPTASGPACRVPSRDPAAVLTSEHTSQLASIGRGDVGAAIARDLATWKTVREHACADTSDRRGEQLACLDGVLARMELVRRAVLQAGADGSLDDALDQLVDPNVCAAATPPRLVIQPSAEAVTAFAYVLAATEGKAKPSSDAASALADKPGLDACAHALAVVAKFQLEDNVAREKPLGAEAITAADACGDDRLRADALLSDAPLEAEQPTIGERGRAALQKAKVAVDRVAQPDLVAELDQQVASVAAQDHRWDDAFRDAADAIAGYAARGRKRAQLEAVLSEMELHYSRNDSAADMQAIRDSATKWVPIAEQLHLDKMRDKLLTFDAFAMLFQGDVAGAHPVLTRLYKPKPHPEIGTQRLEGVVVDAAGHPVANAEVAVNDPLFVDTIGPVPHMGGDDLRVTHTDASGAFVLDDAPPKGSLFAQSGNLRAFAQMQPHAKLVLVPTRRLAGKVQLDGKSPTQMFVMFGPRSAVMSIARGMAPLRADGSFVYDGAPTEPLVAIVAQWGAQMSANVAVTLVPGGNDALENLALAAPANSERTLDVIARSAVATSLDGAEVFLMPGRLQVKSLRDLFQGHREHMMHMQQRYARPLVGEAIPKDAIGKTRQGDLVAHFTNVIAGEVTACVIGINGDLSDPAQWRRLQAHEDELEIHCETAGADDRSIVVEAPPQKRFD